MVVMFPTAPAPPSRRALDLTAKITELVGLCREQDPGLSDHEVAVALKLASDKLTSSGRSRRFAMIAVLLVMAALGMAAAIFFKPR